jgi:hypothetical protein
MSTNRTAQVRRRHRGVDHQRDAGGVGHVGDPGEVGDHAGRVGDRLDVDGFRRRPDRRCHGVGLRRSEEGGLDPEACERHLHQRSRPSVQLRARDDVVAVPGERREGEELGGLAARGRHGTDPALERRESLLEGGDGRVRDARIDVPERLQREQLGGSIGVVEDE